MLSAIPHIHSFFAFLNVHLRLHRRANHLSCGQDSGHQFGHSLGDMRSLWGCFSSLRLHSWLGSHLSPSSRPVCFSTKHSAEVYRFLASLAVKGRTDHLATESEVIKSVLFICTCRCLGQECSQVNCWQTACQLTLFQVIGQFGKRVFYYQIL